MKHTDNQYNPYNLEAKSAFQISPFGNRFSQTSEKAILRGPACNALARNVSGIDTSGLPSNAGRKRGDFCEIS